MIRNNKLSMESENEDKLLTLINLEQIELFDQQAQFRNQYKAAYKLRAFWLVFDIRFLVIYHL